MKKKLTLEMVKALMNTGVKVLYNYKNDLIQGEIKGGTFLDSKNELYSREVAFVSDEPYGAEGRWTIVSRLDNKEIHVECLSVEEMKEISNTDVKVLFFSPKTSEFVKGELKTGDFTDCNGVEYQDRKLALVSDEVYGEAYTVNSRMNDEKIVIPVGVEKAEKQCQCEVCTCEKAEKQEVKTEDSPKQEGSLFDKLSDKKAEMNKIKSEMEEIEKEILESDEEIVIAEYNQLEERTVEGSVLEILSSKINTNFKDSEQIGLVFIRKGRKIKCVLTYNGIVKVQGVARCMKDDVFSYEKGIYIAEAKARLELEKLKIKSASM